MRITVRDDEGHHFFFRIPMGLLLNRLTAAAAAKYLRRYGLTLTCRQFLTIFRAMRDFRRRHRDWMLVEAQSADGNYVAIHM